MKNKVNFVANNFLNEDPVVRSGVSDALLTIKNELKAEPFKGGLAELNLDSALMVERISPRVLLGLHTYIREAEEHYAKEGSEAQSKIDRIINLLENSDQYDYDATQYKKQYFNENLETLVRNSNTKDRIIEDHNRFIRKIDLIYFDPEKPSNILNHRAHMYSPNKYLLGQKIDTFWFNVMVIWSMTIILYLTLYFDVFERIINFKWRKS
jgi:hypothetical protein